MDGAEGWVVAMVLYRSVRLRVIRELAEYGTTYGY